MTESELSTAIGRIEAKIDTMRHRLGEVHHATYGTNGNPGLRVRVDRLERGAAAVRWLVSVVVVAVVGAWVKVFGGWNS